MLGAANGGVCYSSFTIQLSNNVIANPHVSVVSLSQISQSSMEYWWADLRNPSQIFPMMWVPNIMHICISCGTSRICICNSIKCTVYGKSNWNTFCVLDWPRCTAIIPFCAGAPLSVLKLSFQVSHDVRKMSRFYRCLQIISGLFFAKACPIRNCVWLQNICPVASSACPLCARDTTSHQWR